jgi:cation diffusion facilitator CzcD-associated flavoprotein CzcO
MVVPRGWLGYNAEPALPEADTAPFRSVMVNSSCEVAIIGAGPYGLSIAAHLRATGSELRVFGGPMQSWQTQMPAGMFLKSEGCASNLSDPGGSYFLKRYCDEHGRTYGEYAVPVSLETFTEYGLSFQRKLVPDVEDVQVTSLSASSGGFTLQLDGGERVAARRVVVAVGATYFGYVPQTLRQLPPELVSHSSEHRHLDGFKGRDVTVIGGGQSALETAALLHEQGANPRVLVRRSSVAWNAVPSGTRRSLPQRVRRPPAGLGAGWRTRFYSEAPWAFYHLPYKTRVQAVRTVLGPAGAWWLKDRVIGRVPVLPGHSVVGADTRGDRVRLLLDRPGHGRDELLTDHVIAATGYRVDLRALPFLDPALRSRLGQVAQTPLLSRDFEATVQGLYFVGLAAANHFGPVMRFVYGADFAARRVVKHLAAAGNGGHARPSPAPRRRCRV